LQKTKTRSLDYKSILYRPSLLPKDSGFGGSEPVRRDRGFALHFVLGEGVEALDYVEGGFHSGPQLRRIVAACCNQGEVEAPIRTVHERAADGGGGAVVVVVAVGEVAAQVDDAEVFFEGQLDMLAETDTDVEVGCAGFTKPELQTGHHVE
jgi:hypothetical protein